MYGKFMDFIENNEWLADYCIWFLIPFEAVLADSREGKDARTFPWAAEVIGS